MKVKSPTAGRARGNPLTSTGHRAANRVVDILELLAASRDGLALREVSAQRARLARRLGSVDLGRHIGGSVGV